MAFWHRRLLSQAEAWLDGRCLEAHCLFVTAHDEYVWQNPDESNYQKGRADAFTEVLEYIAAGKKA